MTLRKKQAAFAKDVGRLLIKAEELGYEVTFGEAERTAEQARANEAAGRGISDSLHCERLAVDLNLYDAEGYITGERALQRSLPLGEWWESLSPDHRWGGRFTSYVDIWHFSVSHEGRA